MVLTGVQGATAAVKPWSLSCVCLCLHVLSAFVVSASICISVSIRFISALIYFSEMNTAIIWGHSATFRQRDNVAAFQTGALRHAA